MDDGISNATNSPRRAQSSIGLEDVSGRVRRCFPLACDWAASSYHSETEQAGPCEGFGFLVGVTGICRTAGARHSGSHQPHPERSRRVWARHGNGFVLCIINIRIIESVVNTMPAWSGGDMFCTGGHGSGPLLTNTRAHSAWNSWCSWGGRGTYSKRMGDQPIKNFLIICR